MFRATPAASALVFALLSTGAAGETPAVRAQALAAHVKRLASEEWKGRGSGTEGERAATEYIAAHFKLLGCEPAGENGTFFQEVAMAGAVKVDPACAFALEGGDLVLKLDAEFRPFSASASGRASGELVFAGYGIRAPALEYDDYAGLDVAGKIVVVFRHNPRGPAWRGRARQRHAPFVAKLTRAQELGAIGLVVVNDPASFERVGPRGRRRADAVVRNNIGAPGTIPFAHVTLAGARKLFPAAFGATPAELEQAIANGGAPKPASRASGKRATLSVKLEREVLRGRNVCALLRAGAPDALDEVVVVGAHHDHVGTSGVGSLAASAEERRQIHNGADDNASGTSGVLEVARYLAERRATLRRSVLLLTFTGEERGLLGSRHFVEQPTVPLAKMTAMLNMDMIGRLDGRKVFIGGVKTSPVFRPLLETLTAEVGIGAVFGDGGRAPSDNTSFYMKNMPVLFFFSGMHRDYHRPTDDWDKVDVAGMAKIAELAGRTAEALARQEARPEFRKADQGGMGPPRAILGVNIGPADGGVAIATVVPDGPAAKAGIRPGDVIVGLAGEKTPDPVALRALMRKQAIGKTIEVRVRRGDEEITVSLTLGRG